MRAGFRCCCCCCSCCVYLIYYITPYTLLNDSIVYYLKFKTILSFGYCLYFADEETEGQSYYDTFLRFRVIKLYVQNMKLILGKIGACALGKISRTGKLVFT